MTKCCGTCKYWTECSHNHGSFIYGNCYNKENLKGKGLYEVITEYDNSCEKYDDKDDENDEGSTDFEHP